MFQENTFFYKNNFRVPQKIHLYEMKKIIVEMQKDIYSMERVPYSTSGRTENIITGGNKKMKATSIFPSKEDINVMSFSFTMPALVTCPGAGSCGGINKETGKPFCYALYGNMATPSSKKKAWQILYSFMYKKDETTSRLKEYIIKNINKLIEKALSKNSMLYIRIHDAGDFFDEDYARMWLEIIRQFPLKNKIIGGEYSFVPGDIVFLAYTKAQQVLEQVFDRMPENFFIIHSTGSSHDEETLQTLIQKYNPEERGIYSNRMITAIGDEQVEEIKRKILQKNPNAKIVVADNSETDLQALKHWLSNPDAFVIVYLKPHGSYKKNIPTKNFEDSNTSLQQGQNLSEAIYYLKKFFTKKNFL